MLGARITNNPSELSPVGVSWTSEQTDRQPQLATDFNVSLSPKVTDLVRHDQVTVQSPQSRKSNQSYGSDKENVIPQYGSPGSDVKTDFSSPRSHFSVDSVPCVTDRNASFDKEHTDRNVSFGEENLSPDASFSSNVYTSPKKILESFLQGMCLYILKFIYSGLPGDS